MANDILRMSGMNSGLDTEAIVEAMLTTYQTKIDNQNKKLTKLQWEQEAYQELEASGELTFHIMWFLLLPPALQVRELLVFSGIFRAYSAWAT